MDPTVDDLYDLLTAVAADLNDVARHLQQAPSELDARALAQMELSTITMAEDEFSVRIAQLLVLVATMR